MKLTRATIQGVRNLEPISLEFSESFNLFCGLNGSGKTSLLESLHVLGVGKSFRERSVQSVINFSAGSCVVSAQLLREQQRFMIGAEHFAKGGSRYKVDGQENCKISDVAKLLPIQLIDVTAHKVILGGPVERRAFLDWGLFHVEPDFIETWRAFKKVLLQRNSCLKNNQDPQAWNVGFINLSEQITAARRRYIAKFTPIFCEELAGLLGLGGLSIEYQPGWQHDSLDAALQASVGYDKACGYSNCGPQRADLIMQVSGSEVKQILSRGQLKLFVCAMLIARTKLLFEHWSTKNCVFLVDDLHSELDENSASLLLGRLHQLGVQIFITGIDENQLKPLIPAKEYNQFRVERGRIYSVE